MSVHIGKCSRKIPGIAWIADVCDCMDNYCVRDDGTVISDFTVTIVTQG